MTIDGVSGVKMFIGDSRESESSYDKTNKQLKGYDGTPITGMLMGHDDYKKTAEDRKNFVSPSFIIASSYGKTIKVTYEGALKRCATYQEDGYPAGRWRIPTMAEIEFLIKLSDNSKIPQLFSVSSDSNTAASGYWAAGKELYTFVGGKSGTKGFINLSSITASDRDYVKDGVTYSAYVRCVYDAWYWGDQVDPDYTAAGTDLGYKTTR